MNPKKLPFVYLAIGVLLLCSIPQLRAHPYASGVTNNNGTIQFVLNEGGGNVDVVFEDGSTNAMGVLGKGAQSFALGGHSSYAIVVTKLGNGTPSLISSDTDRFSIWNSPRGVDVNKNAKTGHLFGRTYVGNSAVGGTAPNNKGQGLYVLNADLSDSPLGRGTNASSSSAWATSGANGPFKLRIAPDNTVYVSDFATGAKLLQFDPDLNSSNVVLNGTSDFFGTAVTTGSIATGDLVLWTADGGIPAPATAVLGPNTFAGSFNCLLRYDIGAGPLPWTNAANYAYTLGLDSIKGLRVELTLGNDGKIIGGFGRANLSNGNIQILDPTGATVLYNSLQGGSDRFNGISANGAQVGTYAGVRVSPDGRYLASVDINNGITIATLIDGIPDESSIFGIPNTPAVGNARGMCWDAANNIYVASSGQGLLRVYSLGLSTTAITRNDATGNNGSFELVLPPVNASVSTTTPIASQNYINNPTPGTPIPGAITISLSTNQLNLPVVVNFALSGTAGYLTNYTINTGTTANGVIINSNTVTFPAGTFTGSGNWSQAIQIIPTATPVIGPTLTATVRVSGGANYVAVSPLVGTVSIMNTGPQLLTLSAAAATLGTSMNRGIPGDYAHFIITRLGDLNGPGNSPGNVTQNSYTVTNFLYSGTATFPGDYTARAQNKTAPGTEVPVDGSPGIVISPGVVTFTNVIGNPVAHTDLTVRPTNVTVVLALGAGAATNLVSQENLPYSVATNSVTLTEIDNTVGPEFLLWSNSLTSAADSVNWTLTFASTNLGATTVSPVVISNYPNMRPDPSDAGGSNNFDVTFGYPIANDGIAPSPVMLANGWSNVLKMTVNKDFFYPAAAGVNLYPQGQNFRGNYALRFQMYLSLNSGAIDNANPGSVPNEFALFGINHLGTNCNWRPTTPVTLATGGSGPTNSDGIWMAVNAGAGSITPADFDGFVGNVLPNSGPLEPVSNTAASQAGVFKHPPFVAQNTAASRNGGSPVNKWVDVSVEVTRQTNVSVFINRSQVLASYNVTNGGNYTSGNIMLGYLDPVKDPGDEASQFVYYSNVRVVQLSPFLTAQPVSQIVTQGATVSFTSSSTYGSAPITNRWYRGNTTPVTLLQTDTTNGPSITSVLTLTNVTTANGTNYFAVSSDASGSVTSLVSSLLVVGVPNVSTNQGSNAVLQAAIAGAPAATSFQWKTNGVNLVNGPRYGGVTTAALTITNVQPSDAGLYSVTVVNPSGSVTPTGTLSVIVPLSSPAFSSLALSGTNVVLSFTSPNGGDTTNSYTLQSSPVVTGPYTNTPAAFSTSGGTFQITVPQNGTNVFYRLLHN